MASYRELTIRAISLICLNGSYSLLSGQLDGAGLWGLRVLSHDWLLAMAAQLHYSMLINLIFVDGLEAFLRTCQSIDSLHRAKMGQVQVLAAVH